VCKLKRYTMCTLYTCILSCLFVFGGCAFLKGLDLTGLIDAGETVKDTAPLIAPFKGDVAIAVAVLGGVMVAFGNLLKSVKSKTKEK